MAKKIIMPKLDMTMEQGEISGWFVKEGDNVKKGEPIFEVLSEKAAIEVESTAKGTVLKILHREGDIVDVAGTVAIIGKPDEDITLLLGDDVSDSGRSDTVVESVEKLESSPMKSFDKGDKVPATPAAKTLASEEDVLLSDVPVNNAGVVRKQQVADYLGDSNTVNKKITPYAKKIADEHNVDINDVTTERSRIFSEDVMSLIEEKPVGKKLQGIQKISANKLTDIWRNVPMVTLTAEVDVSRVIDLCDKINARSNNDTRINITDVLIKIMATALAENPQSNVSLVNDMLIEHNEINISVAVSLENGLIVPVIKNVDDKGLIEINREKRTLIEKAKSGTLSPDELKGGCMTISNIGMLGVDIFTPILNSPESHIIGVGRIKEKPVVIDGEITIRPMMWISHTFDHRALDGVPAMKVLASVKDMIEEPFRLMM